MSILDGLRLEEQVGLGSFSKVYRAIHLATGQSLAVKVLERDKVKPQRLLLQQQILSKARHPRLIQYLGCHEDKSTISLLMEFCQIGELYNLITEQGRLSQREARHIFSQLVAGVEQLHSMGYCHRDLKPENILLQKGGKVKITDFGLAAHRFKKLSHACGSSLYAAPEMVKRKVYDGTVADVWSCGVILLAMVAGRLPSNYSQFQPSALSLPAYLTKDCKDLIKALLRF